MNRSTIIGLAAGALIALAAWPAFFAIHAGVADAAAQAASTAAPVRPDYLYRNAIIAEFERDVKRNPDQLVTRMLAGQYLQRYRETADVGDLLRALALAKRSLAIQPRYNAAAEATMASADTALHRFSEAKFFADDVVRLMPWDADALATSASADMEIGDYADARRRLMRSASAQPDAQWKIATARYDELTGRLKAARSIVDEVQVLADLDYDNPAEGRAWYHWRAGELAFEAGDLNAAEASYREALSIFPTYWHANNGLAKVYWAQARWRDTIAAADRSLAVYPLPETLGYKYDAQIALGLSERAVETRDLIFAIERIGDAYGLSDRVIAQFEADHGIRTSDAIAIAQRDIARRDDIFAEDALAWALASGGRWNAARHHAERAARLGTEDARLQFHAAVIAAHFGETAQARRSIALALHTNPHFHPTQSGQARRLLQALESKP